MSLQKSFFKVQSHNPDLPPEEWTLVEQITSAGAYSTSVGWGKYKIEVSGAGGGGAAAGWQEASGTRYANAGSAGELKTIFVDVNKNDTLSLSGIVGAGGTGGRARARHTNIQAGGVGGSGYQNGSNGSNQQGWVEIGSHTFLDASTSGGGGGGSTSLVYGNATEIAKGGNGGTARQSHYGIWGYGGTGGSGGVSSGTGASGGAGDAEYSTSQRTGGTGATGYVRIYKSNLYPEPL